MSPKRPKRSAEDELRMDDSIQSILSEFAANKDPTIKDLSAFIVQYLEKTEAMRMTMSDLQHTTDDLNKRVGQLEEKRENTDENVQTNTDALEVMESENTKRDKKISKLHTMSEQNEASLHRLEQHKVDNDIFISGFPLKPNEDEILESLVKLFDIDKEMIAYKYQYEFMPRRGSSNNPAASSTLKQPQRKAIHHMVVSFKERNAKLDFMAAKKDKGPITYEQLCRDAMSTDDKNTTIRCTHRLSKFNLKVQRELMITKSAGNLASFQLHNGTFRLKRKEDSPWERIDTEGDLKPFITTKME